MESREVHIKHLLDTGVVKGCCNEEILSGMTHLCTRREFATYKNQSAFAAASDVDNTSLIDLLAVNGHTRQSWSSLWSLQSTEQKLAGQHVLWQCLKVRDDETKRQDHFVDILLSKSVQEP